MNEASSWLFIHRGGGNMLLLLGQESPRRLYKRPGFSSPFSYTVLLNSGGRREDKSSVKITRYHAFLDICLIIFWQHRRFGLFLNSWCFAKRECTAWYFRCHCPPFSLLSIMWWRANREMVRRSLLSHLSQCEMRRHRMEPPHPSPEWHTAWKIV